MSEPVDENDMSAEAAGAHMLDAFLSACREVDRLRAAVDLLRHENNLLLRRLKAAEPVLAAAEEWVRANYNDDDDTDLEGRALDEAVTTWQQATP